jgi:uncharacterized alpha-E superfamily protein
MTTRIIDAASVTLLAGRTELRRFDNTLWMAVLRSLSAYQMYRQSVRRRVHPDDVVAFLLKDPHFPRSFYRCLHQVESAAEDLPNHSEVVRTVARLRRLVSERDLKQDDAGSLHDFLDELQLELSNLHRQIASVWFLQDAGK